MRLVSPRGRLSKQQRLIVLACVQILVRRVNYTTEMWQSLLQAVRDGSSGISDIDLSGAMAAGML
jgi:hypothetical protein